MTMLLTVRGEYAAIKDPGEEALSIFHAVSKPVEEAYCLFVVGTATVRLGKYPEARTYLEAGLEARGQSGNLARPGREVVHRRNALTSW
jgi:hypothetical protein